jgi:hypothetical protein
MNTNVLRILLTFWGTSLALKTDNSAESATESLLDHVFSNYDKRIRPFSESHNPVKVQMTIVLGILIEILSYSLMGG